MGNDWEDFFEDYGVAIIAPIISVVILLTCCCCCCMFFAMRNRRTQPIYATPVVVASQSYHPNDNRGGPFPVTVHTSEHLINQSQASTPMQEEASQNYFPPRANTLSPTQAGDSTYSSISSSSTQHTDVAAPAPTQAAFRSFTTISRQTELDDMNPPSYKQAVKSG